MYGLFGISNLSLPAIWDRLLAYELNPELFDSSTPPYKKYECDVLLFTDIILVRRNMAALMHSPLITLVVDAPLALLSLRDKIVLLDRLPDIPPAPLQKIIQHIKNRSGKHIVLTPADFTRIDIIGNLITEQQNRGILSVYNSLTMSIPPNRRNAAIQVILRFLFSEINQKNYELLITPLLSPRARELTVRLLNYINTKEGANLLSALQYIRRTIGIKLRTASNRDILHMVDFEQLSVKNSLDAAYDLRYLSLAYRKSFGGYQQ
jgi:hypothetical protein